MARHYSTKDFFRQMPNALLARYFQARGLFGDLDFAAMKETQPHPGAGPAPSVTGCPRETSRDVKDDMVGLASLDDLGLAFPSLWVMHAKSTTLKRRRCVSRARSSLAYLTDTSRDSLRGCAQLVVSHVNSK